MEGTQKQFRLVSFGPFEYDPATGELRRRGRTVKLVGQPRELLTLLIEQPGEVVTREEMRSRLWAEETFVDFEHSLNSAIKKLRRTLGDSAAKPRFIETIARQGYRFIAPVEPIEPGPITTASSQAAPAPSPVVPAKPLISRLVFSHKILFVLVAAALIALAFTVVSRRSPHSFPNGSKLTLLMAGEGNLSDPVISPDGTMLAYVEGKGLDKRIYVRRLVGGSSLRLTREDAREAEPAFAPNGERIAFTRYPADSNRPQICTVPVLGGEMTCVLEGGRNPAWSPEGTRLAFVLEQADGGQALATAKTDGTGLRIILTADGTYPFLGDPSWSPDGSSIAFERSMGGASGEIWLVPAQGGTPSKFEAVQSGVYLHHPVFAPDGKSMVYLSNRDGTTDLWCRDLNKGGSMVQLTRGPGREEWPSISRTGRVVFLKVDSRDVLFVTRLDTGRTSRLFSHSPFLWAPSVSPNSQEIAFSEAEYNGLWRIWAMSLTGADPQPLTSGRSPQIYGRFSRDGKWLIYFTWVPGNSRIWRVPRNGGPAQPLTGANEDAAYGDLSPDGRTLAFVRTESGISRIYLKPVEGGTERLLTSSPSTVPRWSPDGKWIAFSPNRGYESGVFIIHPDGSGLMRLATSGGWPVWMPDGKRVAFRILGPDGAQQINTITLGNGKFAPLGKLVFSGNNDPFDFSPDGKLIVYTNGETFSSEIWLLDTRP